jgi:hypothetical protein
MFFFSWASDLKESNPVIESLLEAPKQNGAGYGSASVAALVAGKVIVDIECLSRLNKLNEAIEVHYHNWLVAPLRPSKNDPRFLFRV